MFLLQAAVQYARYGLMADLHKLNIISLVL